MNLSLGEVKFQISDIFIYNRSSIQTEYHQMEKLILDKIDFNILATLSRDCRTPYSSIGSLVGLTSKTVKARVKNWHTVGYWTNS